MTKQEFNTNLKKIFDEHDYTFVEPLDSDYEVIEFVYNFHPAISNTVGKEQIAMIYFIGRMSVIYDMLPRAKHAQALECEYAEAKAKLDAIRQKQEEFETDFRWGRSL